MGVALMVRGKTGTREVVARTGEVRKYFQRALELRMDDLDNPNSDIFGKGSVPLDGYPHPARLEGAILQPLTNARELMPLIEVEKQQQGWPDEPAKKVPSVQIASP